MNYHYQIYGVPIISEIELPALIHSSPDDSSSPPVYLKLGSVPASLTNPEEGRTFFSVFNEHECITRIPDVASYYTTDGSQIVVEPISDVKEEIALFVYSGCISAVLLQRDVFLMHVSGCFVADRGVLLLAAQSGTGKSTTAAMLRQKGYPTFTDDTAMLFIENGKCFARASYPETRMWKDTTEVQQAYDEAGGKRIRHKLDKFAFSFADSFVTEKVEVKGIVFLEASGDELKVERLTGMESWRLLNANMYGSRYVDGMKKGKLLFGYLSALANILPAWKAIRPEAAKSFDEFSEAIKEQVIQKLN